MFVLPRRHKLCGRCFRKSNIFWRECLYIIYFPFAIFPPVDGEPLCGSIAALRDECSFEKCYWDGFPDGKTCPGTKSNVCFLLSFFLSSFSFHPPSVPRAQGLGDGTADADRMIRRVMDGSVPSPVGASSQSPSISRQSHCKWSRMKYAPSFCSSFRDCCAAHERVRMLLTGLSRQHIPSSSCEARRLQRRLF